MARHGYAPKKGKTHSIAIKHGGTIGNFRKGMPTNPFKGSPKKRGRRK